MSNLTLVNSTPLQSLPAQTLTKKAESPTPKSEAKVDPKTLPLAEVDTLALKSKGEVSPIITISGGAFAGSLVGAASGSLLMGAADLILGGGSSLKQMTQFGGGMGAISGFVSGAVVANMTDSKLKATLYGTLSGAALGAATGGASFKNLPAALVSGAVGGISGGVSAFMTSKWLGH
ncbi:MAG: hypothetical protein AB7I41_24645 [Candidatus Sericytochromatia bacterium]